MNSVDLNYREYASFQSVTVTTHRSTKTQLRQFEKNKCRIKMLIDIAKLSNSDKDCIEKEFLDLVLAEPSEITEKYSYFAIKTSVANLVRWTCMQDDELKRCHSFIPLNKVEPFALVTVDCDIFLSLLLQSIDGIDFENLSKYITDLREEIVRDKLCPDKFSLIIGFMDLDKAIVKKQRQVQAT